MIDHLSLRQTLAVLDWVLFCPRSRMMEWFTPLHTPPAPLTSMKKSYISELETLSLMWAIRYFRPYLLGHPCVVYTDHATCLSILNSVRSSDNFACLALTIQKMDLTIKHKAGRENSNEEALCRNPIDASVVSTVSADSDQSLFPDVTARLDKQKNDPCYVVLHTGRHSAWRRSRPNKWLLSKQYNVIDGVLHF